MTSTLTDNKDISAIANTAAHIDPRSAEQVRQWVQHSRSGSYNVVLPFLLVGGGEEGPYAAIKARHSAVQAHENKPYFAPSIQTHSAKGMDYTTFFDLPRDAAIDLAKDVLLQYTPQSFKNKP